MTMKDVEKKRPVVSFILTVALLFAPIMYVAVAATIDEKRGPIQAPKWMTIARLVTAGITMCCLALPFFIERNIRAKLAEKARRKGPDPELTILIIGSTVFLAPSGIAVLLFLFGSPIIDVYAYSVFSFLAVAGWSWHQRACFSLSDKAKLEMPSRETVPEQAISAEEGKFPVVRAYTILLIIVGLLAFTFLGIKILLITTPPEYYTASSHLYMFWIPFYAFLTMGCWMTAFLRARRSSYALAATGGVSIMLLFFIPFGTAAFVYWLWRVRKKENERSITSR